MEIREFAERVLFATTLEEKLAGPGTGTGAGGELTDRDRGRPMGTPEAPGRPDDLVMGYRSGSRLELPGAGGLESDADRGALLHLLANHELLATELMALVLLKFPDAPAEFRAGVVRTLQEEQGHTRMYLRRMADCGLRFGEQPVNGFFWRSVSRMETPLDYVSRLSLTFEQANLDFSRYYGRLFREAGDGATGAVLEQIYRDEIGHVGYGLEWFRRWKGEGVDDFSALEAQLPFPLSPARAKADHLHFDVGGRLAAGFDEEFVGRLRRFRRSRGRTPDVFLYNPELEEKAAATAVGRVARITAGAAALRRDLGALPMALAGRDDVVLVGRRPSDRLLDHWAAAGLEVPEFVVAGGSPEERGRALGERKLGSLVPWAWEPGAFRLVDNLEGRWAPNARHPSASWGAGVARLSGKAFGLALRQRLGSGPPGVLCREIAEVEEAVTGSGGRSLVKPAYGLAGRQMRVLEAGGWGAEDEKAIGRLLEEHGEVVVEPWLERVMDFSVQYQMRAGAGGGLDLEEVGKLRVENDARGRFLACHAGPKWGKGGDPGALRWLHESGALEIFRGELVPLLGGALREAGFLGPVGVDAFVYRREDGGLALNPVCEVNPRMTMGRIALGLHGKVAPDSYGRLEILTGRAARARGLAGFRELASEVMCGRACPPMLHDGRGRLREGAFVLNEPDEATRALGVFTVGGFPTLSGPRDGPPTGGGRVRSEAAFTNEGPVCS